MSLSQAQGLLPGAGAFPAFLSWVCITWAGRLFSWGSGSFREKGAGKEGTSFLLKADLVSSKDPPQSVSQSSSQPKI